MTEITLKNGFTFDADKTTDVDYELFEDMVDCETQPEKIPSVLRRFLGEEDYKRLKEANRNDDGRIPMQAMTASLAELFTEIGKAKKK